MSKKKKIIAVIIAVLIIIITNVPPVNSIIVIVERDAGFYSYSSKDDTASFYFEHGMGPARLVYFEHKEDDIKNGIKRTDTLYRNFRINPLFFWHWKDYFFDERYSLPYISTKEVFENAKHKINKP